MSLDVEFQNKCAIKTVIAVYVEDIESLIDKYFKNEKHNEGYNLAVYEEQNNYTDLEISVEPEDFQDWDTDNVGEIKEGKWPFYFINQMLNHLCFKRIIKEGDYLINIVW